MKLSVRALAMLPRSSSGQVSVESLDDDVIVGGVVRRQKNPRVKSGMIIRSSLHYG